MPRPNRLLTLSVFMACFSTMTQADEPILFSVQPATGLDSRSSSTQAIPISINRNIAQLSVGDSIQFPALDTKASYRVTIEKVIRHSITDVTLIGNVEGQGNPNRAVITVGPAGSYANIATPDGDYRIELDHGQNLLWTPSTQAGFDTPSYIDDMLIPDRTARLQKPDGITAEPAGLVVKDSPDDTTIDLMILYTQALETRLGGAAALQTRLNHLISLSNQAFEDSQVKIKLRLVHTELTGYSNDADATTSLNSLQQHSNEFSQVPSLRTQYGADLVMLMQGLVPTHFTCGLAYGLGDTATGHMIGGENGDKAYAFSIVHDGRANNSICPEGTLAHEVGHNLGAAHDLNHTNHPGLFPYSYGHDDSPGDNVPGTFATIMSYDAPSVLKFSNPNVSCNISGAPCGILNQVDNARGFNSIRNEVAAFYPTQVPHDTDSDGDGIFDLADNCPAIANANQANIDSDNLGDVCDPDKDGDGVINAEDFFPDDPTRSADPDPDHDGINSNVDNCPTIANANQANIDSDSLGDVCDPDKDGDGVINAEDFFPDDPTRSADPDPDHDGIDSNVDNCPTIANTNQANIDSDSLGDVCDPDKDGDGTPNTTDIFPANPNEWLDSDQDRIGDNADNCPLVANRTQIDTDSDSLGNACDDDDDNDGLPDRWEYLHGFNPLSADVRDEGDFDGDGYSDRDEFLAGTDPRDANDHINAIISVNIDDSVNSNGNNIDIGSAHAPVVLAGPPSFRDSAPGVVRISTDNKSDFKVKFQPWDYLGRNAFHNPESVPLMVLEQGWHSMSDGSIWEVGTFTLTGSGNNNFSFIPFQRDFPSGQIPHLFLTIQTTEGEEAVSARARNVTEDGFQAALFEQELTQNSEHAEETVGYVAIYSPSGSGEVNVDGKRLPYVIQRLGVNGGNTAVLNSILTVQEEQSKDLETDHVMDEIYDVLGIGSALFAQDVSTVGGNPTAPRVTAAGFAGNIEWGTVTGVTHRWVDVPLSRNYQNPIVVVDLGNSDFSTPAVARLRRGLEGGFQVSVNGGNQEGQRVHYMVAEQGTHELAGLKLEAGRVATSSTRSKTVSFDFDSSPAVFSSVMTTFGSGDVETITTDVDESGFEIAMDAPGHRLEVLGWIAIENGSSDDTHDGRDMIITDADVSVVDNDSALGNLLDAPARFPIILRGDTDVDDKTSVFVAE